MLLYHLSYQVPKQNNNNLHGIQILYMNIHVGMVRCLKLRLIIYTKHHISFINFVVNMLSK